MTANNHGDRLVTSQPRKDRATFATPVTDEWLIRVAQITLEIKAMEAARAGPVAVL